MSKGKHHKHLHSMIAKVESAHRDAIDKERKILRAADERLADIFDEIDRLKKTAATNEKDSERYQELIAERGRLSQVIAKAKLRIK